MREYRCTQCEKLLFKGILIDSEIEVKCKRCNAMNVFHGMPKEALICFKPECPNRVKQPVPAP
ncbi:MAG: Com family DNA-binding transcriptional regulator [Patescibacteria group bacterium]